MAHVTLSRTTYAADDFRPNLKIDVYQTMTRAINYLGWNSKTHCLEDGDHACAEVDRQYFHDLANRGRRTILIVVVDRKTGRTDRIVTLETHAAM